MLKIKDYCGNKYLVNLEEPLDDISYMIRYDNHGDEFILVSLKNGSFVEYGWFKDLKFEPSKDRYLREEKLFADSPKKRKNIYEAYPEEAYQRFKTTKFSCFHDETIKKVDSSYAQYIFDDFIKSLHEAYKKNYEYSIENHIDYSIGMSNYEVICRFLEMNEIDTIDNLKKLISAPFTSKQIEGCRGIAAKIKVVYNYFICDNLTHIWIDGNWHEQWNHQWDCYSENESEFKVPYDIPYETGDPDDWGEIQYCFDLDDITNALAQPRLFDI